MTERAKAPYDAKGHPDMMVDNRLNLGASPMRLVLSCLGVLLICSVGGLPVQAGGFQSSAGMQSAAISGVVLDGSTGLGMPGAVVSVGPLTDPEKHRALTDGQGRFAMVAVPAADGYILSARAFGYARNFHGSLRQATSSAGATRLTLVPGQWLANLKLGLWRLGAIAGRVVDERDDAVVGVTVRTYTVVSVAGREQVVGGAFAVTDDQGHYRIPNLGPGRYLVAALSVQATVPRSTPVAPQQRATGELESGGVGEGRPSSVRSPSIDVGDGVRVVVTNFGTPPGSSGPTSAVYSVMFYPAARTIADATLIDLGLGERRVNIDIARIAVPGYRVSGRLEGLPPTAPATLVRLLPIGNEHLGFGSEAATTVAEPDGRFIFAGVPEGQYTAIVQGFVTDLSSAPLQTWLADAPGFSGGRMAVGSAGVGSDISFMHRLGQPLGVWARSSVTVGGSDLSDLRVVLQATSAIRGRVILADGVKLARPDAPLGIIATAANGDPSLGRLTTSTNRPDDGFRFELDGLVGGRYLLRGFNGLGIVSTTWQGQELTDAGFDAATGRDFDDVVVTVTDKFAVVSGRVTGAPDSGAAVIAFPANRARWSDYGWTPLSFNAVRADSTGAYLLNRLPKGEYLAVAVEAADMEAWRDVRFLQAAASSAVRVSVGWGDNRIVDLALSKVAVK